MPGLMRAMARTAVVAGTATAASNAVNRRQADKNAAAYAAAAQPYQQPVVVAPAPAPAPMDADDKMAALERLGALKAQGILTEEEFAQQKAQILNS